ncbi:unnamed protein product [Dicrocoelium dendriticum]|nr:unnamed protein product [Dicrocoelium dendriticum]
MLVPSPISRGAFDQLALFGSRVLNRCFMTSAHLCKGTRQRPRALVSGTGEKSKLRRDSVRQLIISTNRKKWEQSNALLASLQGKHPSSKVYMASKYEPAKLSLADAVNCLRDAAQPDMFDCMENPLRAKFTLNMRTKKKTKCIQSFEAHVVFPHTLDFLPKRKVIAICKDDDEAKLALASGAIHAGSTELISRLQHGAFHWDEYDAVVAHSVWTGSLGKLRTVLKSRLPTPNNVRIQVGEPLSRHQISTKRVPSLLRSVSDYSDCLMPGPESQGGKGRRRRPKRCTLAIYHTGAVILLFGIVITVIGVSTSKLFHVYVYDHRKPAQFLHVHVPVGLFSTVAEVVWLSLEQDTLSNSLVLDDYRWIAAKTLVLTGLLVAVASFVLHLAISCCCPTPKWTTVVFEVIGLLIAVIAILIGLSLAESEIEHIHDHGDKMLANLLATNNLLTHPASEAPDFMQDRNVVSPLLQGASTEHKATLDAGDFALFLTPPQISFALLIAADFLLLIAFLAVLIYFVRLCEKAVLLRKQMHTAAIIDS